MGPEIYSLNRFGRVVTAKGNLQYWQADAVFKAYEGGLNRTGLFVTRATVERV